MTAKRISQSPASGNVLPIVFTKDGAVFASSRDVADYFKKQHTDVLRAIRNLKAELPAEVASRAYAFREEIQEHSTGATKHSFFTMDRDGFTLLAMGFTGAKALQWKVRYLEAFNAMEAQLKQQTQVPNLNDPKQLLKLLGDYAAKAVELESKVDELMPSALALDRIANTDGSMCVTDAAKTLQVKPIILFKHMRTCGWVYKRAGTAEDVAYQSKLQADLLEHKVHTVTRDDGSEKTVTQVRVTPKGLARLAKELNEMLN